jgi:hypothetical protein
MPEIETWLFVPDTHVPYHDKRAFDLVLNVASAIRPNGCIILGDFADCKSVTGHQLKPKERSLKLVDELHDTRHCLVALNSALPPDCEKDYIMGNHEDRIDRYIAKNAPALDGFFSFAEEMGLEDMGWDVIGYGDYLRIDHMVFTHDLGKAGENAHRHARKKVHGNAIIGHTHRMGIDYEGSLDGPHVGAHFGWLGSHAAHDDYKDKIGGQVDTVLGFGLGYRHVASQTWWLHAVPIINYACVIPASPLYIKG